MANGDTTPGTPRAYGREVAVWVAWCRKNGITPETAKRCDVEAYREHLKASGLSVVTRAHKLSITRRFYESAVKHEIMARNPAEKVRASKDLTAAEDKIKALTEGALGALVEAIPQNTPVGRRDRAVIALMTAHGLRRVEVHRLNHESIEPDGDAAVLMVDGKGHKTRRVYLRPDTWEALASYLQTKLDTGLPLSGAVFVAHGNRSRGQRLSRQALNVIVDRHLNASALKRVGISCHALRHTFGTLSVAGGARVEHVRDAMGHSKLETTSVYVKAVERAKNNPSFFIGVKF